MARQRLLLVIENPNEARILEQYFTQKGLQVLSGSPMLAGYLDCVRLLPDLVLLEIPHDHRRQVAFVNLLKGNPKTQGIPVMAYGSHGEHIVRQGMPPGGLTSYYLRPLRIGTVIEDLELLLGNRLVDEAAKEAGPLPGKKPKPAAMPPMVRMRRMLDEVGKLAAFPFTLAKLGELIHCKGSVADLVRVVQTDPSATSCILKAVNTPAFCARGRRIEDLTEAVTRLGFFEIANMVLGLSVMKLAGDRSESVQNLGFWHHSLANAILTEKLAIRSGYSNYMEAFLAGLMRNFGLLLWERYFPGEFRTLLQKKMASQRPLADVEQEIMGFTHWEFTARLFERWRLPASLWRALEQHGNFRSGDHREPTDANLLVRCMGAAGEVTKAMGIGSSCESHVAPFALDLLPGCFPSDGLPVDWTAEVLRRIQTLNSFFRLGSIGSVQASREARNSHIRIGIRNHRQGYFEPHLFYLHQQGYSIVKLPLEQGFDEIEEHCDILVENHAVRETTIGLLPRLVFEERHEGERDVGKKVSGSPFLQTLPSAVDLRKVDFALRRLTEMHHVMAPAEV